jgi:hypothetical protein
MQKFIPNDDISLNSFIHLMKRIRRYLFTSLNGIDLDDYFDNSNDFFIEDKRIFLYQINEMVSLAKKIYFIEPTSKYDKYKCFGTKKPKPVTYLKTINEINSFINKETEHFNFHQYIQHLNENVENKSKHLNGDTKVIITDMTLDYLRDIFKVIADLNSNSTSDDLRDKTFSRSFTNFIYFHSIFALIKPIQVILISILRISPSSLLIFIPNL